MSVTPSGNAYTYVWNSSADLGASLKSNVLFKITPTDAAGFGTPGATAGFAADDRNSPPVIGSLTASPEPVALGGNLTLTASNVVDTDGSVVGVKFYRDVNGNGSIDVGTDQFLGTGTQNGSTWTWTGTTTGFTLGSDTYMAVATDNDSASSNTATATGTVYPTGEYVVNSTADTVAVDGYVTLAKRFWRPTATRRLAMRTPEAPPRPTSSSSAPALMGRPSTSPPRWANCRSAII